MGYNPDMQKQRQKGCGCARTWEKNGKRGMLGHPSIHCWLLWFLVIVQCFIFTFDVFSYGDFGTFLPELSLHCLVSDEGEICCYCCVFSKMALSWSFLYSTPAL